MNIVNQITGKTPIQEAALGAQKIVSRLLSEDEHRDLYDQLLAIAEEHGEGSSLMGYIDLIADIYNGGIQQCIEHGRLFAEFADASRFLRENGGPSAQALAAAFRGLGRAYNQASESYQEHDNSMKQGEGDSDFDPFEEFTEDFDAVEDLLYNKEATDNVHRELLAKLGAPKPAGTPEPQPSAPRG